MRVIAVAMIAVFSFGCATLSEVFTPENISTFLQTQAMLREEYAQWRAVERDARVADDDAKLEQARKRLDEIEGRFDGAADRLQRWGIIVAPLGSEGED